MNAHRSYLQTQVFWLAALDATCLMVGIIAGVAIRLGPAVLDDYVFGYVSGLIYLVGAVLASNFVTGSYGLELRLSRFNMVVNWAFSMIVAFLVVSITSYAWFSAVLGRGVLFLALAFYSALWLTLRLLIYHYLFRTDPLAYRVAVLGAGVQGRCARIPMPPPGDSVRGSDSGRGGGWPRGYACLHPLFAGACGGHSAVVGVRCAVHRGGARRGIGRDLFPVETVAV